MTNYKFKNILFISIIFSVLFCLFFFQIKAETSDEVLTLVTEAETLINEKSFDKAINKLKQAIEKDSSFAPAFYQMGRLYHYNYEYEPAIQNYKKAGELNPSYGEAFYNIGSCYLDMGQYDTCIKWLEKAKNVFYIRNDLPKYKRTLEKLIENTVGSEREAYKDELEHYPPTPFPTMTSKPQITPTPPLPVSTETPLPGEMILISEGVFLMGSNEKEIERAVNIAEDYGYIEANRSWFADEMPRHEVYLDSFYIDRYEVTNKQFSEFVLETGYITDAEREDYGLVLQGTDWINVQGADWQHPSGQFSSIHGRMDYPVVQVSWNDAAAYALWAGKRLPTEAEWEKSCRGLEGKVYSWGNTWNDSYCNNSRLNITYLMENMADFYNNRGTLPVGKFPLGASPYGAMDMIGNVWEWCSDWYSDTYYQNSPVKNPDGPESGTLKVIKGGSWYYDNPAYLRAPLRLYEPAVSRNFMIGFRCAKDF